MFFRLKQKLTRLVFGEPRDQQALNASAEQLFRKIAMEAGVTGTLLDPTEYGCEFVIEAAPGFDRSIRFMLDCDEIRFFMEEGDWWFEWWPSDRWDGFEESALGFLNGDLQVVEVKNRTGKFLRATLRRRGDDGLKPEKSLSGHYTTGVFLARGVPRLTIWRRELTNAE